MVGYSETGPPLRTQAALGGPSTWI